MKKTITHIDLFAGLGGIATGFAAAGIKTLLAVEYIESCCETYSANHPETKVLCEDVRKVTDEQIKDELKQNGLERVDIVSAGFPCETFSTAGSKSRVYNDHRNYLYKEALRLANAANARVLVLENVPAFLSKKIDKGSPETIYDLLVKDLEDIGYKYHEFKVLSAIDYGVPQKRSRFILVASKEIQVKEINLGKSNFSSTVSEALSDLPEIKENTSSDKYKHEPVNEYQRIMRSEDFWGRPVGVGVLSYHITPKHRPGTIERFKLINNGEGLKDLFEKLTPEKIAEYQSARVLPKKWYIQRNYRLEPDKPSKTVTSHCLDELIHPSLNRGLSVREVARLQSFPDWYDFKGGPLICPHISKTQDKYEQVGDAVPPLMSKALGHFLMGLLSR